MKMKEKKMEKIYLYMMRYDGSTVFLSFGMDLLNGVLKRLI